MYIDLKSFIKRDISISLVHSTVIIQKNQHHRQPYNVNCSRMHLGKKISKAKTIHMDIF